MSKKDIAELDRLLDSFGGERTTPVAASSPARKPAATPIQSSNAGNRNQVQKNEADLDALIASMDSNLGKIQGSAYQKADPKAPSALQKPENRLKELQDRKDREQAKSSWKLSSEESEIIREMNLARTQPKLFADYLEKNRKPYFEGDLLNLPDAEFMLKTHEGIKAVDDAIRFLRRTQACPPLTPSIGLCATESELIKEKGPTGQESWHDDFLERIKRWGTVAGEAVEIVNFGAADPKEQVIRLIISDGDSERDLRQRLFDIRWKVVGVSYGNHASHNKMLAISFGEGFYDI